MNATPKHRPECPQCRSRLARLPRRFGDRVISLFVPMLRCRCVAVDCGWQGLVRQSEAGAALRGGRRLYAARPVLEPARVQHASDAPRPPG